MKIRLSLDTIRHMVKHAEDDALNDGPRTDRWENGELANKVFDILSSHLNKDGNTDLNKDGNTEIDVEQDVLQYILNELDWCCGYYVNHRLY